MLKAPTFTPWAYTELCEILKISEILMFFLDHFKNKNRRKHLNTLPFENTDFFKNVEFLVFYSAKLILTIFPVVNVNSNKWF